MIAKIVAFLMLIIAVVHGFQKIVAPSNTEDGKHLLFSTSDQKLPWPLTSGRDPGQLIPHGPHCLSMIEKFKKEGYKSEVDAFHDRHCKRLAIRMANFLKDNPRYTVPAVICRDLRSIYGPLSSVVAFGEGYQVSYSYSYVKANAKDNDDEITLARTIYDDVTARSNAKSQQDVFDMLKGENLGFVLQMAENTPELATEAQKRVLDEWESERTVRMAVLGLHCLKPPMESSLKVVERVLQ